MPGVVLGERVFLYLENGTFLGGRISLSTQVLGLSFPHTPADASTPPSLGETEPRAYTCCCFSSRLQLLVLAVKLDMKATLYKMYKAFGLHKL